jgi:hypothetical protein
MTMPRTIVALSFVVLLGAAAPGAIAQPANPPPSDQVKASAGVRYDHKLERSLFDPGANLHHVTNGAYDRAVGDKGVFMADRMTGAILAVPNAPGAAPKPPADPVAADATVEIRDRFPRPLTEKAEEHNAAVKDYFLKAGIPAAEIAGTHVTTTMAGGGAVKDGVQISRSVLLWYTTHLERSLGGIPIEGSLAFAALDSNRKVISEGVYWPAIPVAVVARAQALRRRLADAKTKAAFLEKVRHLRPEIGEAEGNVVIVHSSAFYHGKFQVEAVYSVLVRVPGGGNKPQIVRFNDTGSLVRMAEETAHGTDSPKRK